MSRTMIVLGGVAPHFVADALVGGEIDTDVPFVPQDGKDKILFFYPSDFMVISAHLINQLNEIKAKVYGVSVDSIYSHLAWNQLKGEKGKEIKCDNIILFSDISRRISAMYSVLTPDGPSGCAFFIIDGHGKIRWYCHTDIEIGICVNELLRIMEKLE